MTRGCIPVYSTTSVSHFTIVTCVGSEKGDFSEAVKPVWSLLSSCFNLYSPRQQCKQVTSISQMDAPISLQLRADTSLSSPTRLALTCASRPSLPKQFESVLFFIRAEWDSDNANPLWISVTNLQWCLHRQWRTVFRDPFGHKQNVSHFTA